ncbi:hypothetical protein SDRG_01075 [Saprolegnia diclina VS20]|uniref:SOCS box domain-containing protein n=1 Tax=Saprolegnia diclina (strain VS20) TaxID=1156394 RepID=T0R5M6_SAPDV|nr:hypothetical protein SDRG_01075 [Saprolegnia diclina VS20]EQC42241.1 hypothetical protein SDRG_01075 [Saprolegnia diclina VS20]|eukprot:XP_008604810.1 hypothetical protein SDRG_01075 [Saprolegnia diclina VS20]
MRDQHKTHYVAPHADVMALATAVLDGDLNRVRGITEEMRSLINTGDRWKKHVRPLMLATRSPNPIAMFELLVAHGALLYPTDRAGHDVMLYACAHGVAPAMIDYLVQLDKGGLWTWDARTFQGDGHLALACRSGNLALVQHLDGLIPAGTQSHGTDMVLAALDANDEEFVLRLLAWWTLTPRLPLDAAVVRTALATKMLRVTSTLVQLDPLGAGQIVFVFCFREARMEPTLACCCATYKRRVTWQHTRLVFALALPTTVCRVIARYVYQFKPIEHLRGGVLPLSPDDPRRRIVDVPNKPTAEKASIRDEFLTATGNVGDTICRLTIASSYPLQAIFKRDIAYARRELKE